MRVTTLGDVTRTYPNKVAGWLRVEGTTYAFFGSTHATSVRVNGVSVYPSSGKTLPHLWDVRRRRQQSQDFWRTLDAQPFSVELEVGAGDLDVSFGSDVVRSFSVAVTTNPAPKDQTFTSRVSPGGNGCGKVDDQYWTCAGEGPELLTAVFTGDAIIRFNMRMKDNDIHSAAAIILRHTSTEQSLLFLDASASKPTLAVEGYMFGGPTKVVGDSPIRAAVWHDYEVGRVEGAFYVWMDNKMLLHWKDSKVDHGTDCSFLIRPWRSIIDVKDIKYETVRNTITVLGTTHPQGNAGKYFNFDRDDLALPEGKSIGSGYVEGERWRGRRVGAKEGTTYLHCRGGVSRGRKRLQLWTFNGLDDGDSHGRREDDAKDGDFQKGDKLTTARWCGLAV
ncbi:unnamed protein product [Effrenium voratum]|uniref:Uncharacterized protein n=1 Tax=Effrenium voratum TaxID=2562239 RepID=A0AA36J136_9DINO|nr:unnamed protein product [Effrenium voratum]CAJ1441168.1 unnamed protein product [Effrenium voratum]CAJ1454257.1 unnamed protein product [Effrenium voratum]